MQALATCLLMLASRARACASQHSRAENATAGERGLRMGLARSDVQLPNHDTSSMEEGINETMAAGLRDHTNNGSAISRNQGAEPLFLTPYLMSGDYETAQRLAYVSDPLKGVGVLPFESYSGYITTNETTNSNIFFWFFPATVS